MKPIVAMIAAFAMTASAETYTLTNGVPVSGTVVSSIVAQVVIKTPLGQLRQIPVAAFSKADRSRLPEDAAGIYVNYIKSHKVATDMIESNQRILESASKKALSDADMVNEMKSMIDKNFLLSVEVKAWKEANELKDSTESDRRMYVSERLLKASTEIKQ